MELAILAPAFVVLLLFVVLAGRIVQARNDVYGAAADAARAASVRQHPDAARSDAVSTAQRALAERGVTCRDLDVAVDTGGFGAGGRVGVEVRCTVELADLSLLAVPGSRTVSARAAEVVDTYRGE